MPWAQLTSPAHPCAILSDLVLLGAPVCASASDWRLVRSVVAGRVVAAFSGGDAVLRAGSLWWGLGVPVGLRGLVFGGKTLDDGHPHHAAETRLNDDESSEEEDTDERRAGGVAPPHSATPFQRFASFFGSRVPIERIGPSTELSAPAVATPPQEAAINLPGGYDGAGHEIADTSADQLASFPPQLGAGSTLPAGAVFAQWWEGIESVDVGGLVTKHADWEDKLPDILAYLGVG